MPFGFDDALGVGLGLFGAYQGHKEQKKANQLSQRALDTTQQQYDANAPFRNLGRQQLGHAEQAYDMGNLGYNPTNPFAAARGPTQSNALITGTANNTFDAPIERPAAVGGSERDMLMQALQTAPAALRPNIQKRLATLGNGPTPPAPQATSYGFGR